MICKWCGDNLAPSDLKCKRCGKKVPALSDCGGFYDLVPEARRLPEGSFVSNVCAMDTGHKSHQQESPEDIKSAKKKKSDKKISWVCIVLTLFGVAFIVIFISIMYGKFERYLDEIKVLRKDVTRIAFDMDSIETQLESLEEIKPYEITEPMVDPIIEPSNPKISEQDISFSFEVLNQRDIKEYWTSFNLGECGDALSGAYILDDKSNNNVSVAYSIDGAGLVGLEFRSESEYDIRTVSVTYKLDEEIFGISSAPETCEWQYRIGSKGVWSPVSKDIFNQTDTLGQTRLSVMDSSWQNLIDNSEETLEMRCKIYRPNTEGGSATFFIEGISLYQETYDEIFTND